MNSYGALLFLCISVFTGDIHQFLCHKIQNNICLFSNSTYWMNLVENTKAMKSSYVLLEAFLDGRPLPWRKLR